MGFINWSDTFQQRIQNEFLVAGYALSCRPLLIGEFKQHQNLLLKKQNEYVVIDFRQTTLIISNL